jgi:hypothetical protein
VLACVSPFLGFQNANDESDYSPLMFAAVWIEPRYEAEVAERLGMTLQILFGVVGMSMWLTP